MNEKKQEVYVVLTWDHDDLVGVASTKFGVADLLARYNEVSPSCVVLGTHVAWVRAGTLGTPKFHMYRMEVE